MTSPHDQTLAVLIEGREAGELRGPVRELASGLPGRLTEAVAVRAAGCRRVVG